VSFTQGGQFELSEAEQAREEQAGQAESEEKSNEIGACFPLECDARSVEEETQSCDGECGDQKPGASDTRIRVSACPDLRNSPAGVPDQDEEDDTEDGAGWPPRSPVIRVNVVNGERQEGREQREQRMPDERVESEPVGGIPGSARAATEQSDDARESSEADRNLGNREEEAFFGHQPPSGSAFSGQQRRWPDPTLPT
jgi:hypothetical protein